jgi:hypothetical protein
MAALRRIELLRRIGGRLWLSIFSHIYSTFGNCGHRSLWRACECPLLGVKRTWLGNFDMSANYPKQAFQLR